MEYSKSDTVNLILERYTLDILNAVKKQPKRFTELTKYIKNETTLAAKLNKLKAHGLIEFVPMKLSDRYVNAYGLSEKGRKIMKELEKINVI